MEFKVGDRVRYVVKRDIDNIKVGEVGIIRGISPYGDYAVDFEESGYKHSCDGLCQSNHGWWCSGDTLELVESKTLRMADGTIIGEFNIIEALPQKDDTVRGKNHFCTSFETPYLDLSAFPNDGISAKNGGKNSMKFTFYVKEGTRVDKTCNKLIPTMTTFVTAEGYGDTTYHGAATCDKADYSERDGILNAIANAVLGGNFDREYEKFLADKKRKYDESCKCKICGRNYYEDEKTGKRTPFTPEDARKHEEWHEQNKKNKREKYLIRKEAKRRLAEAEREGKIEQVMKELYKK